MKPRIIALDLDGTLLGADGAISARNREAVLAAEREGAEIVIATGRRHSYAMRVVDSLGLKRSSAIISSNGTVIRTLDGQLLMRTFLPLETARWLCTQVGSYRSKLVITFDLVNEGGQDHRGSLVLEQLDELNASIENWLRANEPSIQRVVPIEDALNDLPPIQMMLCGAIDEMREAEALLLEDPSVTPPGVESTGPDARVALHLTQYTDRDLSIIDILPAGCSKATGLARLLHLRGFHASDVLAVGDNWNDVAMLDYAGRSMLLGNAPENLRKVARWPIGPRHDQDGVAFALESAFS